jgi:hypothetical protein
MQLKANGVHANVLQRCETLAKILQKNPYIQAADVATQMKVTVAKVYGAVRKLREIFQVGVTNTPRGYILSKDAKMRDDAYHLRLLLGRRNSIIVTLHASLPHINRRWTHPRDRQSLRAILPHLRGDQQKIGTGRSICLEKSKVHKI